MKIHKDLPLALRVFRIPELAQLICDWMERRDQTTMMLVCRHLHSSVVPFVWDYIDELSWLFELLPGLEKTPYSPDFPYIKVGS